MSEKTEKTLKMTEYCQEKYENIENRRYFYADFAEFIK